MNGGELKAWRKASGITMRDLHALSGVDISTISRFENGKGITATNYTRLVSAMNQGNEEPQTRDKKVKIRWHIKQLEILIESDE